MAGEPHSLEREIGRLLRSRGWSLSTAESCTGGLIGHRITQVAGSSDYYRGGIIAYANEVKRALLDVSAESLARDGAVSEPVAAQMAEGVRQRLTTGVGLGITGIMGPGGGTPAKPVGLVYVGVATPDGCAVRRFCHEGTREERKQQSSEAALLMLRDVLGGG